MECNKRTSDCLDVYAVELFAMLMALHLNRLVGYFLLVVIFSRIVSKKFHIHVGTRTFRCAGNKRADRKGTVKVTI